jgi:ABC-type sugar transport system permease subunit
MSFQNILRGFLVYFVLVFVVSTGVGYLYSLVAHGQGVIDWESSFRLAFIFGIVLPVVHELERQQE